MLGVNIEKKILHVGVVPVHFTSSSVKYQTEIFTFVIGILSLSDIFTFFFRRSL